MDKRLLELGWVPKTFLGRAIAVVLGLCLFAFLLVVSLVAVGVALLALGLYLGYRWWVGRSIPERTESGGRVIDVIPEVLDDLPERKDRERR